MKVKIELIDQSAEEEATILAHKVTDEIKQAYAILSDSKLTITATLDSKSYVIDVDKIYYIETVDNKTFISTKTETYESKLKLYELEELLDKNKFLRISKSMICNVRKIKSVKASLNARFDATLLNDERIVISRSYVKDLKRLLGM